MDESNAVLLIGKNPRNQELLGEFIERLGYVYIRADDLETVDRILTEPRTVRFALLDISGFDQGVWQRCARLHTLDIPLLLISPGQSSAVKQLGLSHGARTVLEKPLVMRELAATIRGIMDPEE